MSFCFLGVGVFKSVICVMRLLSGNMAIMRPIYKSSLNSGHHEADQTLLLPCLLKPLCHC